MSTVSSSRSRAFHASSRGPARTESKGIFATVLFVLSSMSRSANATFPRLGRRKCSIRCHRHLLTAERVTWQVCDLREVLGVVSTEQTQYGYPDGNTPEFARNSGLWLTWGTPQVRKLQNVHASVAATNIDHSAHVPVRMRRGCFERPTFVRPARDHRQPVVSDRRKVLSWERHPVASSRARTTRTNTHRIEPPICRRTGPIQWMSAKTHLHGKPRAHATREHYNHTTEPAVLSVHALPEGQTGAQRALASASRPSQEDES